MKKQIIYIAALIINLCMFTFTSCSNDDDSPSVAKPTVDLEEVGLENDKEAMAGTDLHVEATILAEGRIKNINVAIAQKDGGNYSFDKNYNSEKYINILNTTFHEHVDIPKEAPAGKYTLKFTVTDNNNNSTTEESDLTITAYDENHPIVTMINIGNNNDMTGILGGTINVAASIVAQNGIDEIEIEFHNADTDEEYPLDYTEGFEDATNVDFNKDIKIPADCKAGNYHIHFTVTDKKGEHYTAENVGVQLKNK